MRSLAKAGVQTLEQQAKNAYKNREDGGAAITQLVTQFLAADHYLLAVPMWNFSVPYKLKQYIDLITHPNLTFALGEKGMQGLATGNAVVVYSRGGDYSPKDGKPDAYDFQSPYLAAWLGLVGSLHRRVDKKNQPYAAHSRSQSSPLFDFCTP